MSNAFSPYTLEFNQDNHLIHVPTYLPPKPKEWTSYTNVSLQILIGLCPCQLVRPDDWIFHGNYCYISTSAIRALCHCFPWLLHKYLLDDDAGDDNGERFITRLHNDGIVSTHFSILIDGLNFFLQHHYTNDDIYFLRNLFYEMTLPGPVLALTTIVEMSTTFQIHCEENEYIAHALIENHSLSSSYENKPNFTVLKNELMNLLMTLLDHQELLQNLSGTVPTEQLASIEICIRNLEDILEFGVVVTPFHPI